MILPLPRAIISHINLDPEFALAYFTRGNSYSDLSMVNEAIADFEKFITLTDNQQLIESAEREIERLSN